MNSKNDKNTVGLIPKSAYDTKKKCCKLPLLEKEMLLDIFEPIPYADSE